MRILVVEDERQIRDMLLDFLSMEGHKVSAAADGSEGWALFSASPAAFDLIIADMKMPGMDGMALLKRVREGAHTLPCILMTGHADVEEDGRGMPAGVKVLHKPFDFADMVRLVASLGSGT